MKKKILLILMVVLGLALYVNLCGCSAKKTDENGVVIEASAASVFFDEKVLPIVVQYGTVAVGVLSVAVPILGKINKSRKTFDAANAALEAVREDSESVKEKSVKKDGEIIALKKQIEQINFKQDTILKVCKIAFMNNKDLVINGFASEIKKVVEDEKNTKEN